MESYGSYETQREISSGYGSMVFSARKSGDSAGDIYAVKVFSLGPLVGDDQETRAELDPLLRDVDGTFASRARLQQQAAEASRHIAPVFEFGQDARGAWYVTRNYPRSVQKIIEGHVTLSKEWIFQILQACLRGALDLKKTCGRSHGKITPANIFISGGTRVRDAEIALSDPMPGDESEAARYEVADLRSLGRILYQLVRRRGVEDDSEWMMLPIESTAEWTGLFGKESAAWLALCNRLLDLNLSTDTYSLEQLEQDLAQLKPKPPVSPALLATVSAVVVLLVLGGWFAWRHFSTGRLLLTSDPPGAALTVDGKAAGNTPLDKSPLKLKLPKGSKVLVAHYGGLLDQTANVALEGGREQSQHFQFDYGSVIITSDPPGAEVEINGQKVKTPYTVAVIKPGEVKYQLNLDEHESTDVGGKVITRQPLKLHAPLKRKSADEEIVEFQSDPTGAKIYLRGDLFTETPKKKSMSPGSYTFSVVYRDWPPKPMDLVVNKGGKARLTVYLEHGQVRLDSDPRDATVWLGTNRLGNTPTTILRPAGPVTFRFEMTGFETTNETVTVADKGSVLVKPALLTTNGIIALTSDPAPAIVLDADKKVLGRTFSNQVLRITFPPGSYPLTAQYEGLNDVSATLKVEKGKITSHAFKFDYGLVQLESVPLAATVQSGGKNLGTTPLTVYQRPGAPAAYLIDLADHVRQATNITVAAREKKLVSFRLAPEIVSVALNSDPTGAQFFTSSGVPLEGLKGIFALPWGTTRLTAKYPELADVTDNVVVKKGAANTHLFTFAYGTLVVTSTPPGVAVLEKGKQLGVTPFSRVVKFGRVDYDLVYEGKTAPVGVTVDNNRPYTLSAVFEVSIRNLTNSIGLELIRVPGELWVGKYEVTQGQFKAIMGTNTLGSDKPNMPVTLVTWNDAVQFCQKLTQKDEAFLAANSLKGWSYALPAVTEWTKFVGTDPGLLLEAVFAGAEPKEIDPNRKSYNQYSLYDLFGNLAEMCLDANQQKVVLGGNYARLKPKQIPADFMKSAQGVEPGGNNIGFRCVLKAGPTP